ncbi:DNA mismatch repair protein MutS [Guggenheimella bovis]
MSIVNLTPMMRQYMEIKAEVPDKILFYRLGDFYEMFYEDAVIASKELDLVLTSRNAGEGEKAPLCGVPYHAAESYLGTLVKKGYSVAISEQLEDPRFVKGLVKRGIIRIVTPGTLTEESELESSKNNFLVSTYEDEKEAALAYIDLSSFEIVLLGFSGETRHHELLRELQSLEPAEILTETEMGYQAFSEETVLSERYYRDDLKLKNTLKVPTLVDTLSKAKRKALFSLIEYILETQRLSEVRFDVTVQNEKNYLTIDSVAIHNLELFETLRTKEKKGSLLGAIDSTKTPMGSRLLKEWIRKPLRDKEEIERRYALVECFLAHDTERREIVKGLREIHDIERILSKLVFGSLQPKDVRALERSLEGVKAINEPLKALTLKPLEAFEPLVKRMKELFLEDLPATIKDGGFIRPEANEELKSFREVLEHGDDMLLSIEAKEREASGIKNLRIKFNKVFGYFFEVTNSYKDFVPSHFIRKQTLAGSERYFTEELKELENKILNAKELSIELEKSIYQEFLELLKENHEELLVLSKRVASLDVLVSFSETARAKHYVKPTIGTESLLITGGRHPVVEDMIGSDHYVTNDTLLDHKENQFAIITGPNMAGKSTYLRQVALITLLAHMGSFVPAEEANIPLIDQIFTRVGASDDLASGQSTFLVEMNELALILKSCTDHSLVILDEIGRGTSTYDGLAIAWATVEYLTKEVKPFSLFATHYHELTEIEERIEGVKNYRIAVQKIGEDLILLRKIVPGRAHQSYGIEAAKLAGLPKRLLDRAGEILKKLEEVDTASVEKVSESSEVTKALLDLNIDSLTPIEALNVLNDLVKLVKDERH